MDIVPRAERTLVQALDGVTLGQLTSGEQMSIQYFRIEPGATVPMHDHPHEQAGYITEGVLTFVIEEGSEATINGEPVEGTEFTVGMDDAYMIPGGQAHAAENRGDGLVEGVDIFSPPRDAAPFARE